MPGRGAIALCAACCAWAGFLGVSAAASPISSSITLEPSRSPIDAGHRVALSGKVTGEPGPSEVLLYSNPYPYRKSTRLRSKLTAADGSFSFHVRPDRNTRYRVKIAHTTIHAHVDLPVIGRTIVRERALPLGRARVAIVVFHPRDLDWRHAHVHWWFASGGRRFSARGVTRVERLSQDKIRLLIKLKLPAGRYRWWTCFHAPGDRALTDRHPAPGCTGQGYRGSGRLPWGFPGPAAIARAERYLRRRGGHTALAVVDTEGRLSGMNINDQFITGSVVKAMLLVAYLRRLDRMGQHHIDSGSNNILYPMIHVSDNDAATRCWDVVGNSGLYKVAHAAGMTRFSAPTYASWGSEWGTALLTARDQSRFFFEMDSLIPHEFVGYARYLLSHIAGYESWGIPAIARPQGYTVFFKAGWRPSPDTFLVHQIARLEHGHQRFAIAIMTDGDPDMGYGIDTIQGTTAALLR